MFRCVFFPGHNPWEGKDGITHHLKFGQLRPIIGLMSPTKQIHTKWTVAHERHAYAPWMESGGPRLLRCLKERSAFAELVFVIPNHDSKPKSEFKLKQIRLRVARLKPGKCTKIIVTEVSSV